MIISEWVEVNLTSGNIKYYEDLGYKMPRVRDGHYRNTIPVGTKLLVRVEDLPKGSTSNEVDVKCDYCGKPFKKKYAKYIKQRENSIIKKDCCYDCRSLKTKEIMFLKHGVETNTQIPEVKEKMSAKRRHNIQLVKNLFKEKDLLIIEEMFNYKNDRSPIYFICNNHPEEGIQDTNYMILRQGGCGCKKCRYESVTGENCHLWKGGITNLSNYLRSKVADWKLDTLKKYNFNCVLTGINDGSLVIHHLYSFSKILEEVLINTDIELYPEVNMYNENELEILKEECIRLHNKYGLGVPVVKKLHDIFHSTQGDLIIDNGEFEEFTQKYRNFEFDELLDVKYKYMNVLLKEVG